MKDESNGQDPPPWAPVNALEHLATGGAEAPDIGPAAAQGLAGCDQVKVKMTTRLQIVMDAAEGEPQIRSCDEMVQGIEIGGHQLNGMGEAQTADVLAQQTDVYIAAVTRGLPQHCRREVHGKDGNTPASAQVTGKQPGATTEVRRRAKSDAVAPDKRFKGPSGAEEGRDSEGPVIPCCQLTVGSKDPISQSVHFNGSIRRNLNAPSTRHTPGTEKLGSCVATVRNV